MEIKMEVDASQLDDTLIGIFKKLPEEKLLEIAEKTIDKWFSEPMGVDRQLKEADVMRMIRQRESDIYADNRTVKIVDATDEQIKQSYKFVEKMNGYKSLREQLFEQMMIQFTAHMKSKIEEKVKDSPELAEVMASSMKQVAEDFPKFMQAAMMRYFSDNLMAIQGMMFQVNNISSYLDQFSKNVGNQNGLPQFNRY